MKTKPKKPKKLVAYEAESFNPENPKHLKAFERMIKRIKNSIKKQPSFPKFVVVDKEFFKQIKKLTEI